MRGNIIGRFVHFLCMKFGRQKARQVDDGLTRITEQKKLSTRNYVTVSSKMNDLNDLEDMKFEDSNAIKSFNDIL